MFNTRTAGPKRVSNTWIYAGIFLTTLYLGQVWAADVKGLDTGLLAGWSFTGIAKQTGSSASCKIVASSVERDYAGRFFQVFTLTVSGKPTLDRILELKQITKVKTPSFLLSKKYLSFEFEMKEVTKTVRQSDSPFFKVEVIGDASNPSLLNSVRVFRESKVDERQLLMYDCVELQRKRETRILAKPASNVPPQVPTNAVSNAAPRKPL